ncbi:MAG: hypothetical protein JSR72_07600 [Proteobacteria bacterium]|nr:hypothetical protein [Pseudomonadota bacterium]
MSRLSDTFDEKFFFGEVNRFSGSGGELLVKGRGNERGPPTRIEVGDRLIGIGITHTIESMSRPPGPDSFRATNRIDRPCKMAKRGFEADTKTKIQDGYHFTFKPLEPVEFAELVENVSNGAVKMDGHRIPKGTMVASYLDDNPAYSLERGANSPGTNWEAVARGEPHWYVGVGKPDDFWEAFFPTDDISMLTAMPPWMRAGTITFGLSLLSGSPVDTRLEQVSSAGITRRSTSHDFCLSGSVVGTAGLRTEFPIGLRTEIIFKPVR